MNELTDQYGPKKSGMVVGRPDEIVIWKPMIEAPKDGETIVGRYGNEECPIFWSDRPVCMLGSRNGGFPAGWATDGTETDYNLPVDEPDEWRELI